MPTNPPPSLRWTALGFGGQWFSNKTSLFKMVTNTETIGIGWRQNLPTLTSLPRVKLTLSEQENALAK